MTELVYCLTALFTNLLPFSGDFSFGEKLEVAGSQIWSVGGLTDVGDVTLCHKRPARELQNVQAHCRDQADLVGFVILNATVNTAHKLSQRRLTAD